MVRVSLIMLVYRTGQFIERSLRSALEQTFEEMEFILVDDATPDNAMAVAERVLTDYPQRRKQVKIITQPTNTGSAVARQTGLDAATGEYTIYLDSDDACEPTMIEELYAEAKADDADIVICDYYDNFADREHHNKQIVPSSGKACATKILDGTLHGALWNKLIRKRLYTANHIEAVPGVNMQEDVLATVRLCYYANRVAYVPRAFVHYTHYNTQSYVATFSEKSIDNILTVVDLLVDFFRQTGAYDAYEGALNDKKLLVKYSAIVHTRGRARKALQKIYPEATPFIFAHPTLKTDAKYILWFATHQLTFLMNPMLWSRASLKKIRGRFKRKK